MTITLNLKPEVESVFTRKATAEGKPLPEYIEDLLEETVKQEPLVYSQEQLAKNQAAIAMLERWDQEDETDDPEEIARRQADWEEFRKGMNEHHTSNRIIYP